MGWQWHQLDHMQIIGTSLQTDNHASSPPLSSFCNQSIEGTMLIHNAIQYAPVSPDRKIFVKIYPKIYLYAQIPAVVVIIENKV